MINLTYQFPQEFPSSLIATTHNFSGLPAGSDGKESACNVGDPGLIPGLGRYLVWERGMAIYSSIIAWRIPGTEELQSVWLQSDTTE